MANLQVSQINKAYGTTVILENATGSFTDSQKIGVIGRNGAGKSTLCRIIIGEDHADSGQVIASSDLRIAYLEQHDSFLEEETVLDFLMRRTGREHWECAQIAIRFQITEELLALKVRQLSGGFQTRVKLTAMLLAEPNFLILDEPSNYLDLSTLILLENFLLGFRGGFLVVSHDREFLKRTCDHTLEVENGSLTLYPGDIEEYFEFKEEQMAQILAHNRNVEKKKDQLQTFVDRFRAKASMASRAQSKLKQMEKLKTIEIAHSGSSVRIVIPPVERKAGVALSTGDLVIGYPEKEVAGRIDLEIERGERVAVLGDNGQGKTTLLRTLAGDLQPRGGKSRWGTGLKIAYYAQHVFTTLSPEDTVYSHLIREAAEGVTAQDVLNLAGSFLFQGDDVKKKVSVLSGGERARLVLAGLLLTRSHVLLLDEPTNHLDFETVESLGRALHEFGGTVFFISHDRTFVNLIATSIVEVKNGTVKRYPGSYEDYVYHLERVARGEEAESDPAGSLDRGQISQGRSRESERGEGTDEPPHRKRSRKAALQKKVSQAEKKMNNLTVERDKILAEIKINPFHYSRDRNEKLRNIQLSLEAAEDAWMQLQEELEELKNS